MITAGSAFLAPTPPYNTQYLYIIIVIIDNKALFVNVTTKTDNKDATCILKIGDHNYITRDSVINYFDAKIALIADLEKAISNKMFVLQNPASDVLLQRIQKGALISPFLPLKYLKYIPTT